MSSIRPTRGVRGEYTKPSHGTSVAPPSETLNLRAAAERAGVSTSTIRRRKDALLAAGAKASPAGWSIPLAALEYVFALHPATPVDTSSESELVEQLCSENEFLRQQVEQQARTIERQAEAHAVISAQLTQLGQLVAEAATTPDTSAPVARRRWWQRNKKSNS